MKKIAAFVAIIVTTSLLFAAGGKEKKTTTVTIWHSNSGILGSTFDTIIDDFNLGYGKDHNIFIESIYQGKANDVLTKVKANIASGDVLPDIAQLDATAALDMSNYDLLVTPEALGINTENIIPQALAAYRGGTLLAVPFNASALVLYYNKTLFNELGLTPPASLDDLIEIAPKLMKRDENGRIIRYAITSAPTTYELTSFIGAQHGHSYFVNNRNGHDGNATEVLIKKEGTYKAFLEKWKALYETEALSNTPKGSSTEFAAGRTAMVLGSSSNFQTLAIAAGSSFSIGVAPVPTVEKGAKSGNAVGGGALFAFYDKPEIKEVIEYLTSADIQLEWAKGTGYIPVNKQVYEMPEYKSFIDANTEAGIAAEITRQSDKDIVNVWLPSAYQIYYAFQESINDAITGAKTIDKAVDDMTAVIESAIAEYAKQNNN